MSPLEMDVALADWSIKAALLVVATFVLTHWLVKSPSARRLSWVAAMGIIAAAPILAWWGSGGAHQAALPLAPWSIPDGAVLAPGEAPSLGIDLALIGLCVWGVGTTALALSIAAGYLGLSLALSRARAWTPEGVDLRELSALAGVRRPWELRIAPEDSNTPPLTYGWLRPVVILPSAATRWDESRLRAVMLHELAHVRRGDALFQLLSNALCGVLWFNPAVWLGAAALHRASEAAADDAVLEAGIRPTDYASALVSIAGELRGDRRRVSVAVGLMPCSDLERRVASIVGPRAGSRSGSLRPTLVLALGAAAACFALASVRAVAAEPASDSPGSRSAEFMEGYRAGQAYASAKEERSAANGLTVGWWLRAPTTRGLGRGFSNASRTAAERRALEERLAASPP